MSQPIEFRGPIELSPEQVADAFWNMNCEEQAAFYAHLYRVAEGKLCLQTAAIVNHIAESGDDDARDGFCTMHNHAAEYTESATDWRHFLARMDVNRMAKAAKESHA